MAQSKKRSKSNKKSLWLLRIGILLLALALLPVFQVGMSRWWPIPRTPEMLRFQLFSDNEEARERGLRYQWIPLDDVPQDQIHLIWASEDQRFFYHSGIDFDEIREALLESEVSGKKPRGASTITMQAARSAYLWQGRSWIRKGLEAYYTLLMEVLLPKRRILEIYFNVIEFGDGVFGVQAAAETFYGKQPGKLSKEQMAMIAAVMPNPKGWDPREPSAALSRRQKRVLRLAVRSRFPWAEIDRGADQATSR